MTMMMDTRRMRECKRPATKHRKTAVSRKNNSSRKFKIASKWLLILKKTSRSTGKL